MERKTYILLTLCYAMLIFILSSLPKLPSVEKPGFDLFLHAIEYSVFGFLVINCFKDKYRLKIMLLAIIICFLYGIMDEIHQYYVPGRDFSFFDMIMDSSGSAFGILISLKFHRLRS